MNRRSFLTLGTGAGTGLLAGCTRLLSNDLDLVVINQREETSTVDVALKTDSSVAYQNTFELAARSHQKLDGVVPPRTYELVVSTSVRTERRMVGVEGCHQPKVYVAVLPKNDIQIDNDECR